MKAAFLCLMFTKKEHEIRASFEASYDEFLEPIFLFLCARLGDRERAKELAQETFMRTWQYIARGHKIGQMRPFLYTTAYNLFKNELRGKRPVVSLDAIMEDASYEPRDTGATPEQKHEVSLLLRRLQELADPYRETLTMRYIDGLAVQEIAAILGETPAAVSVRIHRGLNTLRTRHHYEQKARTA